MPDAATRRGILASAITLPFLGAAARAQGPQVLSGDTSERRRDPSAIGTPPSVITQPPRQFGPNAPPSISPDPDVIALDARFRSLCIGQATLQRVSTGYELAEGPAWSGQGQYLIFSDVKTDTLYRYIWETGQTNVFRRPSFGTNGNTFDFAGRQISTQDFLRRVVRWEHDGSLTVLADRFDGQPLNSPNDLAPHKDGSIWFTDPQYGGTVAEGHPDDGEGPMNPTGLRDPRLGVPGTGLIGSQHQVLPPNVYRIDPDGRVDLVAPFERGLTPNGLCFSPDYSKVYLVRGGSVFVGEVAGRGVKGLRLFSDCMVDGVRCGPDGLRADKAGNLWCSSSGPLGYAGVTVWDPSGTLIGRIRLPEGCANVCFAGPKRDYLFMMATSSIYRLHLNIQGAGPG